MTVLISRVFDSEYSSRYTQPTKFKYVDGLWIETPVNTGATYNVKVSMEEMTKIDYTVQQNTNTHMFPVTRKRIKEVKKKTTK